MRGTLLAKSAKTQSLAHSSALSFEEFQKSLRSIEAEHKRLPGSDISVLFRQAKLGSPLVIVADESLRLHRLVQHIHERFFAGVTKPSSETAVTQGTSSSTALVNIHGAQLNQTQELTAFQGRFLTLSLFSAPELLVVWNAEKLKAATEKALLSTFEHNLQKQIVILAVEFDGKGTLPLGSVRELGTTIVLPSLSNEDLRRWIQREVERFGIAGGIAPGVGDLLARSFEGKLNELSSEIQRLSLIAGKGVTIESRHLQGAALPSEEHNGNELTRCILRRDLRGATAILHSLLEHGLHPLQISAQLSKAFRVLLASTASARPLHKDLNAPWLIRQIGSVRPSDDRRLEQLLSVIKDLDLELKDSGLEAEAAITLAVAKLCR